MSCTYQSSILHEIKMRIFISRRSSPPHGHDLHQHQRAGDAEDEFTHLCDLIDFAAEMNFKLDDINKHSFNEFQLRCSVLIAGILQLEYWLKPIIIISINQDRNCCRSSCLRRNRSHKTSVWHLGRYSELFYIFIFVHHTFIYYILYIMTSGEIRWAVFLICYYTDSVLTKLRHHYLIWSENAILYILQGVPKKRTFRIIILQAAASGKSYSRRLESDLPEAAACRMMILKVRFFGTPCIWHITP